MKAPRSTGAWFNQTRRPRRKPRQPRRRLEKDEQSLSVQVLQSIGAVVYQLGTRRPRGRNCPKCGTFVAEHQGTCQTPGIADLVVFLPAPRGAAGAVRPILFVEQKAIDGRFSPRQEEFRTLAEASPAAYVAGTVDDVVAFLEARGYLRTGTGRSRAEWEGGSDE